MSIRFSVVGRGGQIVVSSGNGSGNIVQVVEDLLSRINLDVDDRKSYTADQVAFHFIVSSKMVFLCVADETFPVTQAYHYLQTLQNEWTRYYGSRGLTVSAATATAEFGRKMDSLFPSGGSPAAASSSFGRPSAPSGGSDKVEMVNRQIEEVKKQMVQNLDSVLARGEGIEALVQSTSNLNTNAASFRKTAVQLKRHMWWKNAKCWIIIGVILVILAFILALIICKANFKTCGSKSKPKPGPAPPVHHPPTTPTPAPTPILQPPPTTSPPPIAPPPTSIPPTHAPSPPPTVPVAEPHVEPHIAPASVQPPHVPESPPVSEPIHTAPHEVPAHIESPISAPQHPIQPEPHHLGPTFEPPVAPSAPSTVPSKAPSTAPHVSAPVSTQPTFEAPTATAPPPGFIVGPPPTARRRHIAPLRIFPQRAL